MRARHISTTCIPPASTSTGPSAGFPCAARFADRLSRGDIAPLRAGSRVPATRRTAHHHAALKEAGYARRVRKWHLGGFHERHGRAAMFIIPPEKRGGFDTWVGYENNNLAVRLLACTRHGKDLPLPPARL